MLEYSYWGWRLRFPFCPPNTRFWLATYFDKINRLYFAENEKI